MLLVRIRSLYHCELVLLDHSENLLLEIAFLFCIREDAAMQTNFEERMNGIHWWTALAAVAVLNHVSFLARAVSCLAAVLNIHPFRIKPKQS